jgi:N-acetylglucosaminyl-diphospho-decaprenol L-rhamnosyltransferase
MLTMAQAGVSSSSAPVTLTVVIVSYNTRIMTLKALETLYQHTHATRFDCVVLDNASSDGSADAIASAFPQVQLIRAPQNLGFARGNNLAALDCASDYVLLLNPDTELQDEAIDRLIDFARLYPKAGIWGGRTVFANGALNIASCWARPTLVSLLFKATGVSTALTKNRFFNPEAYGGWARDTVRQVDIVVGCFLLIEASLWRRLGGFSPKYFMYGEDADLCLRARAFGYHPMITPNAQIVHHVGASTSRTEAKAIAVMTSRASLIRDHWPKSHRGAGIFLMWLWSATRYLATRPLIASNRADRRARAAHWAAVWTARKLWLQGYD